MISKSVRVSKRGNWIRSCRRCWNDAESFTNTCWKRLEPVGSLEDRSEPAVDFEG